MSCSSLSTGADLTTAHLLEILPGSDSFTGLGPMCLAGQKGRFCVSKPPETFSSCHRRVSIPGRMNSCVLEEKMENLRKKESLRSYPEISQPLANTRDPGGRAVVRSAGWVVSLLFSFSTAWHVIILCLCVKSHPLPKENLAPGGPFHRVLTTGMLHQNKAGASFPGKSVPFLAHPLKLHHPSPSQRPRICSVFPVWGQFDVA